MDLYRQLSGKPMLEPAMADAAEPVAAPPADEPAQPAVAEAGKPATPDATVTALDVTRKRT
jgi:hypothetical protein